MRSLGEDVRDLMIGMPIGCGLSSEQIALLLNRTRSLPLVRKTVWQLQTAGVLIPLPGPVRGRRWMLPPTEGMVDQALSA